MRERILQNLNQLEKTEGITILHAVESGSRAWGFPSPDSDYDVRFIYVRPREDYLKVRGSEQPPIFGNERAPTAALASLAMRQHGAIGRLAVNPRSFPKIL